VYYSFAQLVKLDSEYPLGEDVLCQVAEKAGMLASMTMVTAPPQYRPGLAACVRYCCCCVHPVL
jgi:hypothetical protein